MPTEPPKLARAALVDLLAQAERAGAEGDDTKARSLLSDLHWFAHADGELHKAMHGLEMDLARRRGDRRGAIGQILPNVFARMVSFFESFGPAYEVVQSIDAPPADVYRVISDVASYSDWNPWVLSAAGETSRVGGEVVGEVRLRKGKMRVGHRVLIASAPQRFGWCDLGWFTVFASGRRLRWIEPTAEGSRLFSQIRLYGPFCHLAWRLYGKSIRDGMTVEAEALAKRAVTLSASAA
jgi:uncharacterized protein YndB with AHSA1/START domain